MNRFHCSYSSKASFSSCGLYRWSLERKLNGSNKTMLFIGLNPSKANCIVDDPTMKRLMSFCEIWGYGKLSVVNLFARISQSPVILKKCLDPIGELKCKSLGYFPKEKISLNTALNGFL